MTKTIVVKTKNVYGKELVYPVCNDAKIFASIAGTKTLGDNILSLIHSLGYTINEEAVRSPSHMTLINRIVTDAP